ncbi:putative metal-binding protein [Novosphingobium sp. FSW06-99]|uniref:putative metal-binding protein n=1 Tax=Novosphingobium sp. FSW06-99 TaxID=1739113 RepID=UPI00076D7B51|nr:putative metal-binding protein [Novosphingobium sp. FSW06-99]KUR78069.1 hypothetical protein AQZ49_08570 [Novosphingobium sp. FSW06-99]
MTQVADPAVSRRKFDAEVGNLRANQAMMIDRGIWIMNATFPYVKVAFATVNMKPRMIATTIKVDFTDYDARPLSVKFVDAFEDRELMFGELLTNLPKRAPSPMPQIIGPDGQPQIQLTTLCQAYGPDKPAFLCLPGVREYHDHPGHSGDAWELHRASGEGSLFSIIDVVWRYGSSPINQLGIQTMIQITQAEYPA